MDIIEKIKQNKDSHDVFLKYMHLHLLKSDLPENIPEQKDEEKVTHFLKVTYNFNKATEQLMDHLQNRYHLPDDLEDNESHTNEVVVKVCDYLYQKYGESYLRNYESSPSKGSRGKVK